MLVVRTAAAAVTLSRTLLWGITAFTAAPGNTSKRLLYPFAAASLSMAASVHMSSTASFEVVQIPCLSDNYGYLLHNTDTGETAAIDTPDAGPYQAKLQQRGWTLTHIFNTHHHHDHTGGNVALKTEGVRVYGPASEPIPARDVPLEGGDVIEFASTTAQIINVGGHTQGHIAYYFPDLATVFVGDSLFALGCGRMFEGTPDQFWDSLQRLRQLPDDTLVYCAHEYTASNAKFAASVEPGNPELMARVAQVQEARRLGKPTVPSELGVEKRTNPFLRCDVSAEIRSNVGAGPSDSHAEVFAKVRRAKDRF